MCSVWMHGYRKEWADLRPLPEVRSVVVQQAWNKGKFLPWLSPQIFGWKLVKQTRYGDM